MSGEQVQGLPDVLREWVLSRAEETDRSPDEVLARAVTVSRLLDDHDDALSAPDALGGDAPGTPEAVTDRLADLEGRIEELDADLDEKIDDVRSRVVQVKREADAKAGADHDHPDLREAAEAADELADEIATMETEFATLESDLAALETTFEDGFANYEEVLEYLTDTAEEHDSKLSTVASVLADTRTRISLIEAREAQRRAAEELQAEANRLGVASASCSACGSKVRLGLLSSPECPHCASTFEAVDPASGFFGSPTLAVGTRPALEGETADESEPEDIFEAG